MSKKLFLLLTIFCMGMLNLHAKVYTVNVGQFEKIKINSDIAVVYKNLPDSTGMARYEAEEGNDEIFQMTVKNGTLKIQSANSQWGEKNLPVVCLYSDYLSSVESASDLNVTIESVAPSYSFSATQIGNGELLVDNIQATDVSASIKTGNGSVNISGTCVNATLQMLGTGLISADRLKAENIKCNILGTGSIGCWALKTLNVKGIGTTKIYYKGNPAIKKTGGGKLFQLPEDENE